MKPTACKRNSASIVRALWLALWTVCCVLTLGQVTSAQGAGLLQDDIALCVTCHGTHGEGATTGAPRLAGQNVEYLSHALVLFKSGARVSPIMQPIAQPLSEARMGKLALYFAQQTAPSVDAGGAVSPQLLLAGKQLAEAGAGNVAGCFSCHGEQGRGNGARNPSIAGQPARFVSDRLHEFQVRARAQVPKAGSMTAVAALMDEAQVGAAAAYLSHLAQERRVE